MEHYLITYLCQNKEQLFACIKSAVPATIDFPEAGIIRKGSWSLKWAVLIKLQNSTRTSRYVYFRRKKKKKVKLQHTLTHTVVGDLAASLIQTNI